MATAKRQTRQVRSINGRYPALRVAVQASFEPFLRWAIEDPEEFDDHATDLRFDPEDLFEMYYSGAAIATDTAETRLLNGRSFLVNEVSEVGVTIGLDTAVRERLYARSMAQRDSEGAPERLDKRVRAEGFTVFPDGLAISLDERWSEDRMAIDPWVRPRG